MKASKSGPAESNPKGGSSDKLANVPGTSAAAKRAELAKLDLAALRSRIDDIDSQILAALRERADIVEHISGAKQPGSSFFRPGREAAILRRIASASAGALGPAAIARIWRELISGLYHLQVSLTVAVAAPRHSVAFWDLARNHFGSSVPMTLHRTNAPVLHLVTDNPSCIGILPLPEFEEKDPWWTHLVAEQAETPKVIGRLPFISSQSGRFEHVEALVVGRAAPEESGDDRTLVVLVQQADGMSMTRIRDFLPKCGLAGQMIAQSRPARGPIALLELSGFIAADDPRLAELVRLSDGVALEAKVIGAYPVPMVSDAPGAPAR